MITINGKNYAANKTEFVKNSCDGYYKKLKNGVRLYDQQKTAFVFIFDNGRSDRGIVSCCKHGNGYRYSYSLSSIDEKRLGFANGLRYGDSVDLAEKVLNELYPDKYKVYF